MRLQTDLQQKTRNMIGKRWRVIEPAVEYSLQDGKFRKPVSNIISPQIGIKSLGKPGKKRLHE